MKTSEVKSFDAGHVGIIKNLAELSSSNEDIIYLALFAIKAFCCLINQA